MVTSVSVVRSASWEASTTTLASRRRTTRPSSTPSTPSTSTRRAPIPTCSTAPRCRWSGSSHFTYADRAGHIFYVWNAAIPSLPHPSGGDTAAVPAHGTADVWTRYVPWDSLPQLVDPKGGYVQNSNDPPYFTNLHQLLDRSRYPANFPDPKLGLRTQMSLELIDTNRKLSLADVIALKHSYHMLLADRVKSDLIAAVRASNPAPN